MFTGKWPFQGDSVIEILGGVMHQARTPKNTWHSSAIRGEGVKQIV